MGHRKSHHRETKEGSLDHIKVKNVAHESAHGGSKREKRSHRRKREYDDDSSKRHKERRKRSHSSLKSSRKGKPRERMRKRKSVGNSGSDSDSSFLSLEGAHERSSRTHHSGADVVPQHSQSTKTDLNDAGHRRHSSKRVRLSNENPSNHDAPIKSSRIKEDGNQVKYSELGNIGQYMGVSSHSNLLRSERETMIAKVQEEGMNLEGKKDKILEVELRQKALANFLRHQDGTLRIDEHNPISDGEVRWPDTCYEGEEHVKVKVDPRQMPVVDNFVNIDAPEDVKRWPGSIITVAPNVVDCLAEENVSNLEEGEIKSGNETEEENGSSAVDNVNKNVEGNLHAIKEHFEKKYESKKTNGMEVEGAGGNASQCVNLKQDTAPEKPVKGNTDAHPASTQSNSNNNFQEKTMSVMRGGEMVQVSYKVYIPQRAAELARRRLQR